MWLWSFWELNSLSLEQTWIPLSQQWFALSDFIILTDQYALSYFIILIDQYALSCFIILNDQYARVLNSPEVHSIAWGHHPGQ